MDINKRPAWSKVVEAVSQADATRAMATEIDAIPCDPAEKAILHLLWLQTKEAVYTFTRAFQRAQAKARALKAPARTPRRGGR